MISDSLEYVWFSIIQGVVEVSNTFNVYCIVANSCSASQGICVCNDCTLFPKSPLFKLVCLSFVVIFLHISFVFNELNSNQYFMSNYLLVWEAAV